MYLASRLQAGRMLASQLQARHMDDACAVVALNDGGVMVGVEIAMVMHCPVMLLQAEELVLPREVDAIAGIAADGSFSYNSQYSSGEIDEMVQEYYQYLEQEKLERLSRMHRMMGGEELIDRDLLPGKNIILVSDGLPDGFPLDIAVEFLKPVSFQKLIVAAPFASVKAVDHMHVLADEIYCLTVIDDYIATDHYYDQQDVPSHEVIVKTIQQILSKWAKPSNSAVPAYRSA